MATPTGVCRRINLATGEVWRRPLPGKDEQAARIAELEHALKVARWNEAEARRVADETTANITRYWQEDTAALVRVRGLLLRYGRRKTLPVSELEQALNLHQEAT